MFLQVSVITVNLPGVGGIFLVVQGTSAGGFTVKPHRVSFMVVPAVDFGHRSGFDRNVPHGFSAFGHSGSFLKNCSPWILLYLYEFGHRKALAVNCSPYSSVKKENNFA